MRSLIFGLLLVTCSLPLSAAERPNIVLIMSDDMGYSDIQPYGGEIASPNLQSLADGGLRMTQFYNTARCCPTRASLMTGLYPHQAGVGHMMVDRGHPGYQGELNRHCATIAEVLKPAGYATFMTGKWHLTPNVLPGQSRDNWPCQRGFDRFYGTIHGAGSFFDPNSLTRDNELISPYADAEYQPQTYYYTDAISDHAVRYISEHCSSQNENDGKPFFMYVAYTAAHWPMHALPEDISKYEGKYDQGYHATRVARLERLKSLGLIDPKTVLPEEAEDWNAVEHRAWEIACMQVYAAMIDRMDQGIGKIVDSLREHHQLENTLIFFLQDNGGCAEGLGRRPRNQWKERPDQPLAAMKSDELQLNMIPERSRDGFPVVQGPGVLPGPADTYIAYGRGWANVSNTPFREYKHWVHEGGISTPLIIHWPQGTKRAGELETEPSHLIDIMATCVDVAGAEYPKFIKGKPITPMEGRSLKPLFAGKTIERDAIYWEHEGNRAIRVGDWKLVAKENQSWELYNIAEDRVEQNDLSKTQPERVTELAAKWEAWAARANVLPLGTWKMSAKNDEGSSAKRFLLKENDQLPRAQSPIVHGRSLHIDAKFSRWGTDGVVLAQGGSAHGYVLYIQDGTIRFGIRSNGKYDEIATAKSFQDVKSLQVSLQKNGQISLSVDGMQVEKGKLRLKLDKMPADGLQVGRDLQGQVGNYPADFFFKGKIKQIEISLSK